MPVIEPIVPESTITIKANTNALASAALKKAWQDVKGDASPEEQAAKLFSTPANQEKPQETGQSTGSEPAKDEKLLKARLLQEKLRRQIDGERKKIEEERRQLELEKANSRKWQEAAELAQSGRYIEAAEKAGVTYDQLTQQILNGGNIPPARVAETTATELVDKRLKEYEEQQRKGQQEAQAKHYEESIKQITSEVKYLVDSSEEFPLVKASESYQDVVKLIESEFHRTGRIMSVEEAIKKVEAEALEGLEELFKLEKVRSNILKESPKPKEELIPKTLSQRTTAPIPAPKAMTAEERRQRAIDAFHGRI